MIVTFLCNTCDKRTVYAGVSWITRKISEDGWIVNFTKYDKKNKTIFDDKYILDGVEQE